jgi:pimeloyl-ACP methyl ester carboxylesterase
MLSGAIPVIIDSGMRVSRFAACRRGERILRMSGADGLEEQPAARERKTMEKKRSKGKILLIILLCVMFLAVGGWGVLCAKIYDENFNVRGDSYEPLMLRVEDFSGLQCRECAFPSDHGQMLAGYLYSSGGDPHGVVILAHGFGGGGHNSYMDVADYFTRHGYYVFAYDATGTDRSEGDGVGGVPQGVIDLDHAISHVEADEELSGLPIVLFGHSWGAYSVCSVLTYHPEVRAVIECCGFNSSAEMFESGGKSQAGNLIYAMTPFVRAYERLRFGKYAANTAMDGFDASDASVMVVHSADDDVIEIGYGYDKYYEKYGENPRFTFLRFEDRGHNSILNDPEDTYQDELNAELEKWLETLDYDYQAKENRERFVKDKAEYLTENLDHARWSSRLDEELFARFLDFYDRAVR